MSFWLIFLAIVIAVYILCAFVIPFGQLVFYIGQCNQWYKWIKFINKDEGGDKKGEKEENKKQSPNHVHNYKQDKPQ